MAVEASKRHDLLRQAGTGPWTQPFNRTEDLQRNLSRGNENLHILAPNLSNNLLANRIFFQVNNGVCDNYGMTYRFDMFATEEFLTWPPIMDTILSDATKSDIRRKVFDEQIVSQAEVIRDFQGDLERISRAYKLGDTDSGVALTVLHNVAERGLKIAFVQAHGADTGMWKIWDGIKFVKVDDVVQDLTSRRDESGNLIYGAVYLTSCNPGSNDMSGLDLPMPVVIHKSNNLGLTVDGAKVCW